MENQENHSMEEIIKEVVRPKQLFYSINEKEKNEENLENKSKNSNEVNLNNQTKINDEAENKKTNLELEEEAE